MSQLEISTGISMYFETSGVGDPVVFISGQNTDHTQWHNVSPLFEDEFRTLVFDTRGTGETLTPLTSQYSLRDFAADTVALLDALDIEAAHFIGASMGGKVAQWLAIDYPDRVRSLVLMATTPGGPRSEHWASKTERALRTTPTGDESDPIVPLLVSPEWAQAHPGLTLEMARRRINPQGNGARRMHFQASQSHDASGELFRVRAPTLVLHGEADEMSPIGNAHLLAELIPDAELMTIAGGRHEFFIEYADESIAAIRKFLANR